MPTAQDVMDRLDHLQPGGSVKLPVLTGVDLCVLGATPQPLVEEQIWSWWSGRSEADRASLAAKCMAQLAERGLISTGPDAGLTGEVAIIVAARTRPAFVALRRPDGINQSGGPVIEQRYYGIADEIRGLRGVLAEQKLSDPENPVNTGYRYFLCPVATAAENLASWAAEQPDKRGFGLRRPTRMIDVYRPGHGAVPGRLEVSARNGQLQVTRPGQDPVTCAGDAELSQLVTKFLLAGQR